MKATRPARELAFGTALVVLSAVACQKEAPPALPFADVVVDTNVDVPRTLSRLRIDVYAESGRWLYARDYPMPTADDWPTSFAVLAPDNRATTVLVRVRGYLEGAVRDYRGERYSEPPVFAPPPLPSTVAELCAGATELPPLEERTMRLGPDELLTSKKCDFGQGSGAVAAKIVIPRRDTYRFGIVKIVPSVGDPVSPVLMLRRRCDDVDSEIGCVDPDRKILPELDLELDPGEYTLVAVDGYNFNRDEVTLRWSRADEWDRVSVKRTLPPPEPAPPASDLPRLAAGAEDVTPRSEPSPDATIEVMARVRLVPGAPLRTRLLLDGACLARPSRVVVRDDGTVDEAATTTCVAGKPAERVPSAERFDGGLATSSRGTSPPDQGCTPELSDERVVCIPGGTYVIGATETDQTSLDDSEARTLPRRAVALSRFFMDRHEVTVGRYRQALGQGFSSRTSSPPYENSKSIGPTSTGDEFRLATFSERPMDRESYPLNELTWDRAREICRFYAGDLPTEAQWEYVAAAVGRVRPATYPWGEAEPACDQAVFGREPAIQGGCLGLPFGPRPVDGEESARDVTPAGIVGMGGNLRELVRDTYEPYDAACWRAAGALDPSCVDDTSPYRASRGSSWLLPPPLLRAAYRRRQAATAPGWDLGFRCVYKKPPVRKWTGP